jgi:hypothetical protein
MAESILKKFRDPAQLDHLFKDRADQLLSDAKTSSRDADAWIEARAKRAGKTIDELLLQDRERLRKPQYPGPDCYEPYEVEQYISGTLNESRISHHQQCGYCAVLLDLAIPSEQHAEAIINELRGTVTRYRLHSEVDEPFVGEPANQTRWGRTAGASVFITGMGVLVPMLLGIANRLS